MNLFTWNYQLPNGFEPDRATSWILRYDESSQRQKIAPRKVVDFSILRIDMQNRTLEILCEVENEKTLRTEFPLILSEMPLPK